MQWMWCVRVRRTTDSWHRVRTGLAAAGALLLAACNQSGQTVSIAQPRGATVAFDSIDGPPQRQFQDLVKSLNDEAQRRQLAVLSRDSITAYRVRGYLAAKVSGDHTTISWVWDVFDRNEQRAMRISGEETARRRVRDAWTIADDAMLQRIARSSMDNLAAFLSSPEAAPGQAVADAGSPEAAGIFRIRASADPAHGHEDGTPEQSAGKQDTTAGLSAGETLSFAASGRH